MELFVAEEAPVERTIAVKGKGQGYFPVVINTGKELLAVMRGGAEHIGVDGRLDLIRSSNWGASWSAPTTVAAEKFKDVRNPAFGQTPTGRLILAYVVMTGYKLGYVAMPRFADAKFHQFLRFVYVPEDSVMTAFSMYSDDDGKSWSSPEKLSIDGVNSLSPYGRVVAGEDGTLLMPVYGSEERQQVSGDKITLPPTNAYVLRSRDNGLTWGDSSLLCNGCDEFSLVRSGRKLVAVIRSSNELFVSSSEDSGYRWEKPMKIGSEVEHPGDIVRLNDGSLLIVHGHRKFPYGVRATISSDGGATWSKKRLVLGYGGIGEDCGYPSIVRANDGKLVLLYYQVGSIEGEFPEDECATLCLRFDDSLLAELLGSPAPSTRRCL